MCKHEYVCTTVTSASHRAYQAAFAQASSSQRLFSIHAISALSIHHPHLHCCPWCSLNTHTTLICVAAVLSALTTQNPHLRFCFYLLSALTVLTCVSAPLCPQNSPAYLHLSAPLRPQYSPASLLPSALTILTCYSQPSPAYLLLVLLHQLHGRQPNWPLPRLAQAHTTAADATSIQHTHTIQHPRRRQPLFCCSWCSLPVHVHRRTRGWLAGLPRARHALLQRMWRTALWSPMRGSCGLGLGWRGSRR
ncbi:hypothetical protein DUNSADRAFT_15512 [Dunaliella salina]|uniref:Encoded protein n=1 Tax=Dunaliella salina TaxID=3046 RepID=A0ABQ7H1S0_DUNSA|nr:hypothetical protein DUNSADRAFT_15512 [Dunaliella salina]|eukprot:KAF5840802.1 hypothetical protein DUNSADRAFT_15512 [Dunaliella salina]